MRLIPQIIFLTSQLTTLTFAVHEFVIPGWDLQSRGNVSHNLKHLSTVEYDSSGWHRVPSRSTVFGGLIDAGVYNTQQFYFSTNLRDTVDYSPYYSPWLYRAEFSVDSSKGKHVFLQTNGITSKADIYLNGQQVANKTEQAGTYGGHTYDITNITAAHNALLIQAYPTDYNLDFAQGYVDWNPYPPDNGTGVWRNVTIKQTGSVAMGPLRITHDWTPGASSANVMLKANLTNFAAETVSGMMEGVVSGASAADLKSRKKFTLSPKETKTVTLTAKVDDPQIWWPRQWGGQHLYTASVRVLSDDNEVSDQASPTAFGIRHITSAVNKYNGTLFTVNGHPFQVRGGGMSPDLFLRWNSTEFEIKARYALDMGLNTMRLEGKEEQPELYEIADRLGLMILPGWECCDKWEAWSFNDEVDAPLFNSNDYATVDAMMRHEAAMLQTHPSVLGFLVGSDFWPDDRAAAIYVAALKDYDWPNPIIASAALRGYPEILGVSGMKMDGPYDWVPPNYWYYNTKGGAFGFGSELGAGVGTPELGSLKQFLTEKEMNGLWKHPNVTEYHQNNQTDSPFRNRKVYNEALFARYGEPESLTDYLLKAQMMDYEATRAQFEAYQAKWNAENPATGLIYWMLNNAWPSLHWNLFDYYFHPNGAYFGTKVGSRTEHVAYSYDEGTIYLINHSLNITGQRDVAIDLIDVNGKVLASKNMTVETRPNSSRNITAVPGLKKISDLAFLRVVLSEPAATKPTSDPGSFSVDGDSSSSSNASSSSSVLSRNIYWLSHHNDVLDWHRSNWWTTRVSHFADFSKGLSKLKRAHLVVATGSSSQSSSQESTSNSNMKTLKLTNHASVPAFFIRLNLVDAKGDDVVPVQWSDNYVTLFPGEELEIEVQPLMAPGADNGMKVEVSGWNVKDIEVPLK